jgi:hypothetical protein
MISGDQPTRKEEQVPGTLIGLGILLLIIQLYLFGAHRHNRFYPILILLLISGIPFVLAVWWTFRRKEFPAYTLSIILIGGALFRLILVPLDPQRLSTDIYRYIWDERLQEGGVNPYLYVPVDPRLAELRDDSIAIFEFGGSGHRFVRHRPLTDRSFHCPIWKLVDCEILAYANQSENRARRRQ